MPRRAHPLLFLLLVLQLGACSFGGKGGVFPRVTYGVPARWLINEEVSGRVVDFASCKPAADNKEDGIRYAPSACAPVAGAKVTLSMGGYSREDNIYMYTAYTDETGRFHFERHTTTRLVDTGRNRFDSGDLIITAEGYPEFRVRVSWSDTATPKQDSPQYDNSRFHSFMAGDSKKLLLLFLTVSGPPGQARQ